MRISLKRLHDIYVEVLKNRENRFYSILFKLYLLIQKILSFLVGGTECICCGKTCYGFSLCNDCQKIVKNFVPFDSVERCKKCRKILISEIEICSECRENFESNNNNENFSSDKTSENNKIVANNKINANIKNRQIDEIFPINMYKLWKKDLMFVWKGDGERGLSIFFADLMANAIFQIKKLGFDFNFIVPIPIRPGKLKKVGWDQINDIKKILQKKYNFTILDVLERLSSTEQKKLSREDRKGQKGAVYRMKKQFLDSENQHKIFQNKKILIIDDVITTGSTLEKCAKILKLQGAEKVYGLSLFIVD